ncbi:MAG: alpha-1,2-fucosyltransferase [Chlamydiota bacterium]
MMITTRLTSVEYVTVDFKGCQFGNQLFQVAAVLSLAIDNDAQAVFPQLARRKDAGFPKNYKQVFFRLDVSDPPIKKKTSYVEPHYHYAQIPYKSNIVLYGYFQSEKYFKHNKNKILPLFAPNEEITNYLKEKYGHLLQHNTTVGVHLRSYLVEKRGVQMNFPTYSAEYYEKAMQLFPEETLFIVCSNNIKWAKKMLKEIPKKMVFAEGNDYLQDFYLISMCDNQIICNSSFSWWAAYMNPNPNKRVIIPPHYFRNGRFNEEDLFPEEWEKITDLKAPYLPISKKPKK